MDPSSECLRAFVDPRYSNSPSLCHETIVQLSVSQTKQQRSQAWIIQRLMPHEIYIVRYAFPAISKAVQKIVLHESYGLSLYLFQRGRPGGRSTCWCWNQSEPDVKVGTCCVEVILVPKSILCAYLNRCERRYISCQCVVWPPQSRKQCSIAMVTL